MRMVNVDKNIITKLRESGISDEMKSIESSDWIIYETIDNEIIGAAGIGGIFHTSSINIHA